MVGEKEVRLFGIDAPEFDQTCKRGGQNWGCGSAAADELMKLVTGKQVRCDSMGVDQHQRILGRCTVGTTDINRTMVATGYAVAYRHYSSDYVSAEEMAKAYKRGLWAGTFQMPSDYRHSGEPQVEPGRPMRAKRAASSDWQGRANGNCNIKGNRNRKGQWIYHLPGMPYYDQTRAEEIFCTEADAQAAGYRRAIVR
ncbi:thermonuclease family protein [Sphingomonas sp. SM33]|uniref:Thermonuclease family protein n=1 Tax=Sphingomonas telluris TaxID=2907998 RepID=A0ABS9VPL8_9SPHN|nr:thermonuclease family protein [Sphingomonas telluris]MCH8616352.1 thermonuclease family protein [Sphingomonas telluris]